MNKAQLVEELTKRLGSKKAAQDALDSVLDVVTRSVAKGEKVVITGFGAFEKRVRPARYARNPATGERVRVAKTSVPKFKPGSDFKAVVGGAKKLPRVAADAARSAGSATRRGASVPKQAQKTASAAGRPAKSATKRATPTKATPRTAKTTARTAKTTGRTAASRRG